MFDADYLLQMRIERKTDQDQILLKTNLNAPSNLNWAHSPAVNKQFLSPGQRYVVAKLYVYNDFFKKHVCVQGQTGPALWLCYRMTSLKTERYNAL